MLIKYSTQGRAQNMCLKNNYRYFGGYSFPTMETTTFGGLSTGMHLRHTHESEELK